MFCEHRSFLLEKWRFISLPRSPHVPPGAGRPPPLFPVFNPARSARGVGPPVDLPAQAPPQGPAPPEHYALPGEPTWHGTRAGEWQINPIDKRYRSLSGKACQIPYLVPYLIPLPDTLSGKAWEKINGSDILTKDLSSEISLCYHLSSGRGTP